MNDLLTRSCRTTSMNPSSHTANGNCIRSLVILSDDVFRKRTEYLPTWRREVSFPRFRIFEKRGTIDVRINTYYIYPTGSSIVIHVSSVSTDETGDSARDLYDLTISPLSRTDVLISSLIPHPLFWITNRGT